MKTIKKLLYALKDEKQKGVYFIHSDDEDVKFTSYHDLFKQSLWMKNYLYERGIRPNDEVILSTDNSEWFYITFWACILGNFKAAPLSVSSDNLDNLRGVLEVCYHAAIVTDNETLLQEIDKSDLKLKACICWDEGMSEKLNEVLIHTESEIDDSVVCCEENDMDTAYIQFSSGSTSDVKGVGITNAGVILIAEGFNIARHLCEKDVFVTWVPLYHNYGLFFNILLPINFGCDAHVIDTQYVIKNPLFYLEYCNRVKGTVLSSTNYYLKFICKLLQERGAEDYWDLSSINTIMLAAEPISMNLCNQFTEYLKDSKFQRIALNPAYGLTEGTFVVTLTTDDSCTRKITVNKESLSIGHPLEIVSDDDLLASEIISVGKPLPFFQLKILDLAGNTLEDGCIGLVFIAGKCVLNEYYNRGRDDNFVEEWFNTGDIGFMYEGNLYITARYKEMFIYNSLNYYDNDIEKYIEKLNIFDEERIVVHGYRKNVDDINDEVICFIEGKTPIETLVIKIKSVLSHINNDLGIYITDFVLVDHIPTTVSGKIQRYKLLKNYIKGEYDSQIAELTREIKRANNIMECDVSSIENFIVDTLEDIVDTQIDYSASFISMGLDSLQLSKLHMAINIQYGDCIAIAEIFEYTRIETLAEYIMEKIHMKRETETLIS
ncbi:peptide synthetase [Vallitalea longa]|uniref:Peptide synthetase n=1 Tax=Vallitalea longa TaxID=2936439 RepID=A0A9W5YBI8_9FIRM|nr:AMP-binding protein [Vallitalea longa]GKX30074.1 peptide synthetase [Vallitalea longa]